MGTEDKLPMISYTQEGFTDIVITNFVVSTVPKEKLNYSPSIHKMKP